MGFLRRKIRERFEARKPKPLQADIRMLSGCEDQVCVPDGLIFCSTAYLLAFSL